MSLRKRLTSGLERALPNAVRRRYVVKFNVVLLLVAIILAGGGIFIHFNTESLVQAQTQDQIRGNAESEAQSVSEWVSTKQSTTTFLADSVDERGANVSAQEHQRWLEQKLVGLPVDVQSLHYVDRDNGTVIASTTDDLRGQSLGAVQEPWAASDSSEPSTGSVALSEPYEVNDEAVIAFSAPLAGTNESVVLTASLSSQSQEFRSSIATGDIKVVTSDGTILLDNRQQSLLDQYEATDGGNVTAIEAALSGETGYKRVSARTGMESGDYAMAYAPVTGTDWVITYHVPASQAFALQTQVSENIGLLFALAVGALLIIGATMGRGTAKSLSVLSEAAEDIASGEIDSDLPETERVDEMGQLYDSFASMQAYLRTAAGQADALADKRFDDPVLDDEIPGAFGKALEAMGTDLEALITDIEEAKEEAETAQQEAEAMAASLEAKATEFSAVMNEAAAGDLTQRMDTDSDHEAMVNIAESFNAMLAELDETISTIQQFSDDVAVVSEEMSASVAEVKDSSEDVSRSIQEIADGATDQSESLQQVSNEMNDLSATIEEVAATADTVAEKSRETADIGQQGRERGDSAVGGMEAIQTKMQRSVEAVESLDDQMDQIGDIVGVISDIAEQTNILALNANIEAAHGQASGDGFEVVANEVKQLAEETKDSASQIEDIIADVETQVERTVEDIRTAETEVQRGAETVETAVEAFDQVVENVDETDKGIQEISDVTDDQAASTQEVVSMVDTAAEISDETQSGANNVAAAAEEQTSALTEISSGVTDLAESAQQLEDELNQFEVDDE